MTTQTKNLIDQHLKVIELLEDIATFERRIELKKECINGFSGTFPELKLKYEDQIDTYNRCIARLYSRYEKAVKTIDFKYEVEKQAKYFNTEKFWLYVLMQND